MIAQLLARRLRHVWSHALFCFIAQIVNDLCRSGFEIFEGGGKKMCECALPAVVNLVNERLGKLW